MKIELRKVNKIEDGGYWYGIWVNGSCQSKSFGIDYDAALIAYEAIVERSKTFIDYETIKTQEL